MNKSVPHFKLLQINETHDWCDEIVERAGKLFGIYLVDINRVVYCCELEPSYEADFLYTVWAEDIEDDEEREELNEIIDEVDYNSPLVSYFHVRSCNERAFVHDFGEEETGYWEDGPTGNEWKSDDFDTYERLVDNMKEHCNANHYA